MQFRSMGKRGPDIFSQDFEDWCDYVARSQCTRLKDEPGAIGAHLCGAYIRNRYRGRGLIDEMEQPDPVAIREIRSANQAVARWLSKFGS